MLEPIHVAKGILKHILCSSLSWMGCSKERTIWRKLRYNSISTVFTICVTWLSIFIKIQ